MRSIFWPILPNIAVQYQKSLEFPKKCMALLFSVWNNITENCHYCSIIHSKTFNWFARILRLFQFVAWKVFFYVVFCGVVHIYSHVHSHWERWQQGTLWMHAIYADFSCDHWKLMEFYVGKKTTNKQYKLSICSVFTHEDLRIKQQNWMTKWNFVMKK